MHEAAAARLPRGTAPELAGVNGGTAVRAGRSAARHAQQPCRADPAKQVSALADAAPISRTSLSKILGCSALVQMLGWCQAKKGWGGNLAAAARGSMHTPQVTSSATSAAVPGSGCLRFRPPGEAAPAVAGGGGHAFAASSRASFSFSSRARVFRWFTMSCLITWSASIISRFSPMLDPAVAVSAVRAGLAIATATGADRSWWVPAVPAAARMCEAMLAAGELAAAPAAPVTRDRR